MKSIKQRRSERDEGFTLIELLIAIVVVGVLTAVVIIGVGSLTNNGETAACRASADAAKAGSAVFYSNSNGTYPADFTALTTATSPAQPALELANGVALGAAVAPSTLELTLVGNGWILTMDPAGAEGVSATNTTPTFTCA